jgi:DegV family protein with EDD domain
MTIKIVTDSTADLTPQLAKEHSITVVPVYLRFGDEVFHDQVDISADEFYRRLSHDAIHPSTTQPSPQDFADVYKGLTKKADGIISIHVSSKLSGTCNSALQGKEAAGKECPIEVIDSQVVTMGLGQLAIAANTLAQSGKSLQQVVEEVKQMIPSIHVLGLLDTLTWL